MSSFYSFSGFEATPVTEAPFIWSPGDRQERARRLHSDMLVFQDDMARAKTSHPRISAADFDAQLAAWRIFRDDWGRWYGSAGATTWLFGSTDTLLEDYEKKLAGWRQWYSDNVGTPAGQGPGIIQNSSLIPSNINVTAPDLKDASDPWRWWWIGGGLALLGGGTFLILRRKRV